MPALSAGDLTNLRSDGHKSLVYLSVEQPPTLLSARLNDAGVSRGDSSITWDTGSGSDWNKVQELNEVWVGSAAGLKDKGVARIRSARAMAFPAPLRWPAMASTGPITTF